MPPISMLIKPASGLCNLKCTYCFYRDVTENREMQSYGIMSYEIAEEIVKKALEQADNYCSFAFQGGEPTLAGLHFFKYFVELQKKYNTRNIIVANSIQTNGVAITQAWADFFKSNNFLVGLSLDGTEEIHDSNRVFANGTGSFKNIQKTVRIFDKTKVDYNILCVVTAATCNNIEAIYDFYKSKGFKYLQFIPCLDPLNEERGKYPYSLTPEGYEKFLKKLFNCWYKDFVKGDYVSIRHFDNWISILMGNPPESCAMNGTCQCYFVIEADGSVYPCDFYVLDEFKLGNIQDTDFASLSNSPVARKFVTDSRLAIKICRDCKYYNICRGGCRRDRLENLANNYYCDALYNFFECATKRMQRVVKKIRSMY